MHQTSTVSFEQHGLTADPRATKTAGAAHVDFDRNRFPFSIVWQPFPILGWILPCIGHVGICDSQGIIHDFQGPYTIIKDNMMLGAAARYIALNPAKIKATADDFARAEITENDSAPPKSQIEIYDACVRAGNCDYSKRIHCLMCGNTHKLGDASAHIRYCTRTLRRCILRYTLLAATGGFTFGLSCCFAFCSYPNCNHHVTHCLNVMKYGGWSHWGMVSEPFGETNHLLADPRYVQP